MKHIVLWLLLLVATCSATLAQTTLTGKVKSDKDDLIAFATVVLFQNDDTLHAVYSTLTDLNGGYKIENITTGNYVVSVSCLGYTEQRQNILITDAAQTYNAQLTEKQYDIDEVTVQANRTVRSFEKTSYAITSNERSRAANSFELLRTVPTLKIDPINKTVTPITGGGNVQILINGLTASERELMAIRPSDVVRIEHYDTPTSRYSDSRNVINIITNKQESGGNAGISLEHAVTTGFFDDMAYFKYNKGRSQISLQYTGSYRNYKNTSHEENFQYTLNDTLFEHSETANRKFGYFDHNILLNYINRETDNYAFQIKLRPNFSTSHSNINGTVTSIIDTISTNGSSNNQSNEKEFNPVADIYFSKHLPNKQELFANVVGTGFYNNNEIKTIELSNANDTMLFDQMIGKVNKTSIISQIGYTKKFETFSITLMAGYKYAYSKNIITNLFNNPNYYTKENSGGLIGDITGKIDKLSYQFKIGGSRDILYESYSQQNAYKIWSFATDITLGYNFTDAFGSKLLLGISNNEPKLSQLSRNKLLIANRLVSEGNPELKHSYDYSAALNCFYNGDALQLNFVTIYNYTPNRAFSMFSRPEHGQYIAKSPINSKLYDDLQILGVANYSPIDMLYITLYGGLKRNSVVLNDGQKFSHMDFPLACQVDIVLFNMLLLSYNQTIPHKTLSGPFLSTEENTSSISLSLNADAFSAAITWHWPFNHAKYRTESTKQSIVQYTSKQDIMDNGNMITFSLSYDLQFGRKFIGFKRKTNNADTDSGVFSGE